MLIAIDRQYPADEDKQRLARQLLNQMFELADEAAEIARELDSQVRAAGLPEAYSFMLEGVPVLVRKAREAAQRRDWEELNLRLGKITADGTHGIRDTSAMDMEACGRYLDKLEEMSNARSRLNEDIASPDFSTFQAYLQADRDDLRRAQREAGFPSNRSLIEWA